METPSSNNSINSSNIVCVSKKIEDSELSMSKSRQIKSGQKQQDRCVLIDITNDSPIVGVASGGNLETPLSSSVAKQKASRVKSTPGSGAGEALLRGQVKTLLQKVEEEAELSKLSLESRPFLQLVTSPMALLAPTPVNTPQVPNLRGGDSASVTPSPMVEEQLISQVVNYLFEGKSEESTESEKSVITRSLMDFSEKSEISELTPTEDDVSSNWSIQVNAGTHDEDEKEIADTEEDYEDAEEEEEEEEEGDTGMLDELCRGLNNVSVNERVDSKFTGKHTRFIYNSDDELVDEEEGVRKHTRFPEEEEEDGEFMN